MVLRRADAEDRERRDGQSRPVHVPGGGLGTAPALSAQVLARVGCPRRGVGGRAPCWPGPRRGPWCSATRWSTRRGGALTLGLGLLPQLAVLPHAGDWSEEKTHRTVRLASGGLRIAAIDERTALLRARTGAGYKSGHGQT